MKGIMVDIETLATATDAAVISIGAVAFELNGATLVPPAPDDSDYRRFWLMDLEEQLAFRSISAKTFAWWARQSSAALSQIYADEADRYSVYSFGNDFADFFESRVGETGEIWAKPPRFDLEIIRDMLADSGLEAPWHFRQERDLRTVIAVAGDPGLPRGHVQHNALADAEYQVSQLAACLKRIREGCAGQARGY